MKVSLFDFQEDALVQLHTRLTQARTFASVDAPQAVSFSAPTGSGKTIVMTALFEDIFFGEPNFPAQADAVILWLSDMPELNEQTRLKIEGKSDRIRVRQLVTIDFDYDAERLEGGHIYFVNTQKLGTDKLLTRRGDGRRFTIWETLTNTAKATPDRFYVVIDEAHRGMRTGRAAQTAQTIMQRFLLGSPEDGLCPMPLVVGLSATPRRFEEMLAGTSHSVHKVHIPADEVRSSGLLKERILIHYPDSVGQAEMTLLAEAASSWQGMATSWEAYCRAENLPPVRPILVVQVEDGTDGVLTKTDIAQVLSTIEGATGQALGESEVAHSFTEGSEILLKNRKIRYIEASRIAEDPKIRVVLFKMSLSTGWDCPQAEVMMSFRRAQDHTYIAQLLGRMVRTPLARQVDKDAALNDVHLFLPHYNDTAVKAVVDDLQNAENVPPATVGTSRELVTLSKRAGSESIFKAMQQLVTYRINAVRRQSSLRRLMGLGRGLTQDQIDSKAQTGVTQRLVAKMVEEVQRLRDSATFDERAQQITGIDLQTIAIHGTIVADGKTTYTIDAASADIDRHFENAGRRLGNGLHMEYWKYLDSQGQQDAENAKVEVIVLAQDNGGMQALENYAEQEFDRLYELHKRDIAALKEQRRQSYERLRLATAQPQTIDWNLPDTIAFRRSVDAQPFDKHLYTDKDGGFSADLGTWEREVLAEELLDPAVVGWLRNVDRQKWSLEIPYRDAGTIKPMYPDMVIVRQDTKGFHFDILEPHDANRSDNAAKAVGLAEFAEKHWYLFDRIELIRKKRSPAGQDVYYRLNVGRESVRRRVLGIQSNSELDQVFDNQAEVRSPTLGIDNSNC